jgi:LPXTG-motif cell wall-anchored protein
MGTVTGAVVDKATRDGLAGAAVVLIPQGGGTYGLPVTSGPGGTFRFTDVPPGQYCVGASLEGYVPGVSPLLTVIAGDPAATVVELEAEAVVIVPPAPPGGELPKTGVAVFSWVGLGTLLLASGVMLRRAGGRRRLSS